MADGWIKTKVDIVGPNGDITFGVTVYLPFPEAVFGVQRSLSAPANWVVMHVATTYIAVGVHAMLLTRAEALILARRMSQECPAAARIVREPDGSISGPMEKLRNEVRACLYGEDA